MTHPLAALIAGVPRYIRNGHDMVKSPDGPWLHQIEVLAALEAAPPMGVKVKDFDVEIVRGNTGGNLSLYFNDHRVAGSKPWGGGTTIHSFRVQGDEVKSSGIFATIRNVQSVPADKDFLTTAALAPTDSAQAREAALREAAAKAAEHMDMHNGKDMNSYRAALGVRDAILALIGEPRT